MSEPLEMEVASPGVLEQIQRADIDIQIATSKKYPRSIERVKSSMLEAATLDRETAAACFYTLPRGGKNISGPSVRLAEIALSNYQNMRVATRVVHVEATGTSPHVIVQSVCNDMEKNVSVMMEKRRRITPKNDYKTGGKKAVDEDDINLACNACAAIAFRDAVFKVVPMALVKPVCEAAKRVAVGDAKTLNDRRAASVEAFAKMGVHKDRLFAKLGVSKVEEIGLDELETLVGLFTALRDGDVEIDEAFPEPKAEAKVEAPKHDPSVATPAPEPPKNVATMPKPAAPKPAPKAPVKPKAPEPPAPVERNEPPVMPEPEDPPQLEPSAPEPPQAPEPPAEPPQEPSPTEWLPDADNPHQSLIEIQQSTGLTDGQFLKFMVSIGKAKPTDTNPMDLPASAVWHYMKNWKANTRAALKFAK